MNEAKLLQEFGFSNYEIKVYIALAHLNNGKVGEIAKESGVPPNKVYGCLTQLVQKGYVSELGVFPREFKILGMGKFKEQLEQKEKKLIEAKQRLNQLEKDIIQNKAFSESIATVFRGKDKIIQMQDELTPKINKYQYSLVGGTSFTYSSARLIKQAVQRGAEVRFLTHYDPPCDTIYRKWKAAGVKIRFHPKEEWKSIRFSTFDGKWCRITIGKPQIQNPKDYLTFWLESPAFALLLKEMFLDLWDKSVEKI